MNNRPIIVNPMDLQKASERLHEISATYTEIYKQLMQEAETMGDAWDAEDNLAFVDQIHGFLDDLKMMADKIENGSAALKQIKTNYVNRQEDIIAQARKLTN